MLMFLLSWLVAKCGFMQNADLRAAAIAAAVNKCAMGFFPALLRGIGCNILVCGAV